MNKIIFIRRGRFPTNKIFIIRRGGGRDEYTFFLFVRADSSRRITFFYSSGTILDE